MANATNATKVGNLINSANPLPDAVVETTTSVVDVAATGTVQTDAAPISARYVRITNNTAANGVILPLGVKGQSITVYPALITNAPKVYPPVGGTIANGTVNASVAATARTKTNFVCIDDTGLNWV